MSFTLLVVIAFFFIYLDHRDLLLYSTTHPQAYTGKENKIKSKQQQQQANARNQGTCAERASYHRTIRG